MTQPLPLFVSQPIARVDIAWICVATDDPSPLHLDEPYAQSLGHRSVVVPGTMLLGWLGQYFEDWSGRLEMLRQWRVRFVSPVWPGDHLSLSGAITGDKLIAGKRVQECEVTATAPDGRTVARAWASRTVFVGEVDQ